MKIGLIFSIMLIVSSLFASELKLSWYSWKGFIEYEKNKNKFFKNLPSTNRMFVSFNPKEIKNLKHDKTQRKELKTFLALAKQRNVKIELLLGDPRYVYPKNHENLISLIEFFKPFAFSGIQLDIEPSGLVSYNEKEWIENIAILMKKIDSKTDLKIGFALNHSLAKKHILDTLESSKVNEVVIMYYSVNSLNIQNKLNLLMNNNKDLKFSLALSIEPLDILPKEETFAVYGREKAFLKWKKIDTVLKKNSNFVDIVIQSLYDYNEDKI